MPEPTRPNGENQSERTPPAPAPKGKRQTGAQYIPLSVEPGALTLQMGDVLDVIVTVDRVVTDPIVQLDAVVCPSGGPCPTEPAALSPAALRPPKIKIKKKHKKGCADFGRINWGVGSWKIRVFSHPDGAEYKDSDPITVSP